VLEDVGSRLAELLAERSAWVIASSDFSHYEPDDVARRLDRDALEPLLRLDLKDFRRIVSAERMSICGVGAISILVSMACTLGLRGAKLLAHETSGDATGDRTAVVGYAAVAFFGG
jgi:AmmeMemoRadiSam system protein B